MSYTVDTVGVDIIYTTFVSLKPQVCSTYTNLQMLGDI